MNSDRICWRRRSSDASSITTSTPAASGRWTRMTSTRGSRSPTLTSPVALPPIGTPLIIPSARGSRNASITVRPISRPGLTSSRAYARSFARSMRRSWPKCRTPTGSTASSDSTDSRVAAAVLAASAPARVWFLRATSLRSSSSSSVRRRMPTRATASAIVSPMTAMRSTSSTPRASHTPVIRREHRDPRLVRRSWRRPACRRPGGQQQPDPPQHPASATGRRLGASRSTSDGASAGLVARMIALTIPSATACDGVIETSTRPTRLEAVPELRDGQRARDAADVRASLGPLGRR